MKYKNNPFNIRKGSSRWLGSISKSGAKFESFDSLEHGVRAYFIIMRNYALKYGRYTPRSIITRFAPPSENNVQNYIDYVYSNFGLHPDTILHTCMQYFSLAIAMAFYESHTKLSYIFLNDVWKHYNIKNSKFPIKRKIPRIDLSDITLDDLPF